MSQEITIPDEIITNKICLIREQKVMLDSDLAELYHVETRRLNERIKRNIERFPKDFMFRLTTEEWKNLKSKNATSSWGGRRKAPYAFTEHGVLIRFMYWNFVMRVENAIKPSVLLISA